ncbi:MAG: fructose-1,6-bisphosphatase I [Candidatus Peregrinibacteria bacterium Gr01-1014_25]|nr:MAG: fructose-1,6-bisphosphatase I [Candidatus Peregrinibacteria bacterium Gr01-1014_25]
MKTPQPPSTGISLNEHLRAESKAPDDLRHLIIHIATAAKYIQFALRTTEAGLAGTTNQFGEEQVKLDVLSDKIIRQHLTESRLVASLASEEHDEIVELSPSAPYSVVYDPLDGSSLVETNLAIGSIFGIYAGSEILGRKPSQQVAALYVFYGPRTILTYSAGKGVHSFLLNDVGEFILLRGYVGIGDSAKNFSAGNLKAVGENEGYRALVEHWMEHLTMRYSGCMVADVHHIFSKGQGVFANVGGGEYPEGKLRLVFECGPFAYLAEQAGGAASDGTQPLTAKPITSITQRTPILLGSKEEVRRAEEMLG